jgi:hypothetical protein
MRYVIAVERVAIVIFLLLALGVTHSLSPLRAQDQPTETPTETVVPTDIPTATDVPTETSLPTVTPTPLPLPTETATETTVPTETATDQSSITPTLSVTDTAIDTAVPTDGVSVTPSSTSETETATASATEATGTATETATATASATQPAFEPEPPLTLLFTDTFDTGSLILWNVGSGWSLTPHDDGQALQAVNSDDATTFVHNTLNNAVVQARFAMNAGMMRLSVRQSEEGAYTAILAMNGELGLYRGDQIIGTATVTPSTPGTWRTLRLSAINNIVRVSLDDTEVVTVQDTTPLPPGTFSFAGVGNTNSTLSIDDVSLWIPSNEVAATATPTLTVTPTPTSIAVPDYPLLFNDNFDDGMALRWHLSVGSLIVRQPPGYAIRGYGNVANRPNLPSDLSNVIAEARFKLVQGTAQILVRVSDAGSYSAVLHDNSQVDLFRGDTLVQTVQISTSTDWRRLRLAAIDNVLHVWVDGAEILTWTDDNPLPDGRVIFGGFPLQKPMLMDDVFIWAQEKVQINRSSLRQSHSMALSPSDSWSPIPGSFANQLVFSFVSKFGYDNGRYFLYDDGLYLADADGSNLRLLLPGYFGSPSISPDGTKIAFSSGGEIHIMNTNGTGEYSLTNSPNDSKFYPSWSPDGTRLVYENLPYDSNFYQIVVQNIDGSGRSVLASDTDKDYTFPKWSPTDDLIAFSAYDYDADRAVTYYPSTISVLSVNNPTSISRIATDSDSPDWAHNSNRLVYTNYFIDCIHPINPTRCLQQYRAHTVNADGTNNIDLHDINDNATQTYDPIWSADDQKLIATYGSFFTIDGMYIMNADGSDITYLYGSANEPLDLYDWANVVVEPIVATCDLMVAPGDITDQPSATEANSGGLIWAINQANASPNPTTLCLSENSTYTLSSSYEDFFADTGLPRITTNVTIEGNSATIQRDTNSPEHFRILGVDSTGDLKLNNVTIRDGLIDDNAGAGLVIVGGNATIDGTIFVYNDVTNADAQGGAIFNYFGNLHITDSTLTHNTAALSAGSLYNWGGFAQISQSCIANNSAGDGISVRNFETVNIQAKNNWWGDASGPTNANNPGGTGQAVSDNISFDFFLTQANCEGGGLGGGSGDNQPPPPSFPYCRVQSYSSQGGNIHADNNLNSTILDIVPQGNIMYVFEQPIHQSPYDWYHVVYSGPIGWIRSDALMPGSIYDEAQMSFQRDSQGFRDCLGLLPSNGSGPTMTPTPVPIPPPSCLVDNPADWPLDWQSLNSAYPGRIQMLVRPCNVTFNGYGANIEAASGFYAEYVIMKNLNEDQKNIVWASIANPYYKGLPIPKEPPPSDEIRNAIISRTDSLSCGFVALSVAMSFQGTSPSAPPIPRDLMLSAASVRTGSDYVVNYVEHAGDTNIDLLPHGPGFGWEDFLNEISHGISIGVNAFPISGLDVQTTDSLISAMSEPNTLVMATVMIDQGSYQDIETLDEGIKRSNGLLVAKEDQTPHWILMSSVSTDGNWFRIYNTFNNQVEYYTRAQFEEARSFYAAWNNANGGTDSPIIKITQ